MHDLIRGYAVGATHLLADEVREAALRRVVDFYLHTAYTADHLLRPHRPPLRLDAPTLGVDVPQLPDTPAAMAWFDAEHANLLAIQQTGRSARQAPGGVAIGVGLALLPHPARSQP